MCVIVRGSALGIVSEAKARLDSDTGLERLVGNR